MTRLTRAAANAWIVVLFFTATTVAMTWPLASVLNTRIAADIGDPVFSCWVMMWTGGQVLRFLSGDFHALAGYWNGNIFYPERLTIAYAEHLTPQMLQILPVFAVTHNIVLCYNLLFLSSIILSALGMYLFVRELTKQPIAAIVAGAAFAFAPYRADQYTHIQVISTQWMPLALYGFQRYFAGGRPRALAGAVAAIVIQALSCGYYLFFFTPFAALFAILEGVRRGAWRRTRAWVEVGVAGAIGLLVIVLFVQPYFGARALNAEIGVRSAGEIREFSADTWALGTASSNLAFWHSLQAFPRPEGAGFPGFTILVTGLFGVAAVCWAARARVDASAMRSAWRTAWRTAVSAAVIIVASFFAWAWASLLVHQRLIVHSWFGRIRVLQIGDIGWYTLAVIAIALLLIPRFRQWTIRFARSTGGFLVLGWLAALVLALGPEIFVQGHSIGAGPYKWLADLLPGFDGLRVPSRYFMVAALFLAALAGIGVAALARRHRLTGALTAALLTAGILVEGRVAPFTTSKTIWARHYGAPETTFPAPPHLGAVYDAVKALPDGAVLAEFPFGADPFEIRAMYFAGYHRKPIVNGFSGFFPVSYLKLKSYLEGDPVDKPAAWNALVAAGVTHVVVHEQPWPDGKGPMISAWIRNAGGREIVAEGSDRLFAIR